MAETLVFQLTNLVLGQIHSTISEEVKLATGLKDELARIKSNLTSIQAVFRDAEKQQTSNESIKNWLEKLRDVMYDIQDVLDDIATEAAIRDNNKGHWRRQVSKFFSHTNPLILHVEWAHQIYNLRKKLVWIKDEKDEFELSVVFVDFVESSSRETHSMVNKSKVLGRDKDRDEIMEFILNCVDCSSLSVVPIVGLGGIGKTTVAQLLYNDSRIDENFQLKLWVCVSKKFNIKNILKEIYSSATGEEEVSNSTLEQISLEQLRNKICKTLKDKKYFLILDNVWNEDSNEWIKLREFINELLSKSLFMKQEKTCFEYVFNVITLHDLVQDLAKSMVGEELATINRSCKRVTEKVRYITVDEEDMLLDEDDLSRKKCHEKLLKQAKKAWVLTIMPAERCLSKTFLKSIISKFKSLRVLDLSDWQFEELPVMIGFMKHLRYLRLGANRGIKKLPDSICNLVNLQYLNLNGCCNLEKLPDEIGRLRNLKYLRVSTRQEVLPEGLGLLKGLLLLKLDCPNLKFLPKSINQLENLNYLQLTGCKELELGLESLLFEGLNNLRRLALLYLPKLQNFPIGEDVRPYTCLEMLWVVGCPNFGELPYTLCVNKVCTGNGSRLSSYSQDPIYCD